MISSFCSVKSFRTNSIAFVKGETEMKSLTNKLMPGVLLIIPANIETVETIKTFIRSENPELDFIKIINEYFTEPITGGISATAVISKETRISRNVTVGEHTVIGPEVSIGENTEILNNVVVYGKVSIGSNCLVKDNATIGSMGYNYVSDEKGLPFQYPNLGRIIIGDHVTIGSNSTIESASTEDTVIMDFVKIDDLVHVGYNSIIGKGSMIEAGSVISRNVRIAEDCIIAPNSTLAENISVRSKVIVGIGSVVLSDLEEEGVYVGNPARFLRKV